MVRGNELHIPLEGVIDIEEERQRLDKDHKSDKDIASLEKRLNNPGFTNRAPAHVVANLAKSYPLHETGKSSFVRLDKYSPWMIER